MFFIKINWYRSKDTWPRCVSDQHQGPIMSEWSHQGPIMSEWSTSRTNHESVININDQSWVRDQHQGPIMSQWLHQGPIMSEWPSHFNKLASLSRLRYVSRSTWNVRTYELFRWSWARLLTYLSVPPFLTLSNQLTRLRYVKVVTRTSK